MELVYNNPTPENEDTETRTVEDEGPSVIFGSIRGKSMLGSERILPRCCPCANIVVFPHMNPYPSPLWLPDKSVRALRRVMADDSRSVVQSRIDPGCG